MRILLIPDGAQHLEVRPVSVLALVELPTAHDRYPLFDLVVEGHLVLPAVHQLLFGMQSVMHVHSVADVRLDARYAGGQARKQIFVRRRREATIETSNSALETTPVG